MSAPALDPLLVVIPSVPVWQGDGVWLFDRKFHDGMCAYVAAWPGPVRCVMQRSGGVQPSFGLVARASDELPFELMVLPPGGAPGPGHLAGARIVLAGGDGFDQFHVSGWCRERGIRCVYVIEYTLQTRLQINALEAPNRLVEWRRRWFLWNGERRRRAAFALADGIQANGVPAYEAYGKFGNGLLYFDTRVSPDDYIGPELDVRLAHLDQREPLRLYFSGRLTAMKGAQYLLPLAARLRDAGCPFSLDIFGDGDLAESLRQECVRLGLETQVRVRGAVDFNSALLPEIRQKADLYVLPHPQGDPACTYMETLACGIPIMGFGNEAFAGLMRQADIGWSVPIGDLSAMVCRLMAVNEARQDIAHKARVALAFARGHDFKATFERRVAHLRQIAQV